MLVLEGSRRSGFVPDRDPDREYSSISESTAEAEIPLNRAQPVYSGAIVQAQKSSVKEPSDLPDLKSTIPTKEKNEAE